MRRFFTWCTTAIAVACMSHACKYDDSALTGRVDDLEGRIEKLEELCRQMNTNISSLQTIVTALQSNDYVTGVTPILEEGTEIGYTITFGQNNPITIYHGQKGETGATGNDGHTPTIGVALDTDGNYYWTLDGNWLTDDVGNKIKAQGESGAQGITPQLKIENGYWYVSYDNQQTWVSVGPATSEGGSGNSMFERVTQDDENVYFTLIGGETITLPKASSLAIQFEEGSSLTFLVGDTKTIHYTITGGNTHNVIKAEMLNDDEAYTLYITPTSPNTGTIEISAKVPGKNQVIVSVSNGRHTIMAAIKTLCKGITVTVEQPGTLSQLLSPYDINSITDLTIIGSLNETDINTLSTQPKLTILDISKTNLETLPNRAFAGKYTLNSIVLPTILKEIGEFAFSGCNKLTGDLIIPPSVISIGEGAFGNCKSLTGDLIIPDGVTSIENTSFLGCSGLTTVTIPQNITSIGDAAFFGCSELTGNLILPENIISIGSEAFKGCTKLTKIYCKSQTPPQVGNNWISLPSSCTLYVPTGCAEAYRTAPGWSTLSFQEIIETEF